MITKIVNATDLTTISEIISQEITQDTLLFLSGGSTPRDLYSFWATEKQIHPGAVAMIDERYGEKFHEKSNEVMIRETGLLDYFESQKIEWYPILEGKEIDETAIDYEQKLSELFDRFPRRVALMGIGEDGHTSGIPPNEELRIRNKELWRTKNLVESYDIKELYAQGFGPRITLTFEALSQMTHLVLLVFGDKKKWALQQMVMLGNTEEIPGKFYSREEITERVVLLTDQTI